MLKAQKDILFLNPQATLKLLRFPKNFNSRQKLSQSLKLKLLC